MTSIRFIDTNAATNGSGTFASPYNVMPNDFAYPANTIFAIKAGSVIVGGRSMNNAGVKLCAYGSGPKPIWYSGTSDQCIDLTTGTANIVENLKLVANGNAAVKNASSFGLTDVVGHLVKGCTISNTLKDNSDNNGVNFYGKNHKVLGCYFDDIATDAIWIKGDTPEIAYNRIIKVAQDNREAGDCVQLVEGNAPHVHHNYLDHSDKPGKQCVILSGGSTLTSLFEYNYCIHSEDDTYITNALYSDAATPTFRKNIVVGGVTGIWCAGDGVIESNLVLNNLSQGVMLNKVGGTFAVRNNTIVTPNGTGLIGVRYSSGTASTAMVFRNNIVQGFRQWGFNLVNQTNVDEDYNLFFDCAIDREGTKGTNSFNLDPEFDIANRDIIQRYIPSATLALQLGTNLSNTDLVGASFVNAIGAIQPDNFNFDKDLLPQYWSINGAGLIGVL